MVSWRHVWHAILAEQCVPAELFKGCIHYLQKGALWNVAKQDPFSLIRHLWIQHLWEIQSRYRQRRKQIAQLPNKGTDMLIMHSISPDRHCNVNVWYLYTVKLQYIIYMDSLLFCIHTLEPWFYSMLANIETRNKLCSSMFKCKYASNYVEHT